MGRLSDIPLEIAERLIIRRNPWPVCEADRDRPAARAGGKPLRLLAYSRECIIIDGGRTRVCLRGTDLQLVAMDSAAVLISGTIVCAEFA